MARRADEDKDVCVSAVQQSMKSSSEKRAKIPGTKYHICFIIDIRRLRTFFFCDSLACSVSVYFRLFSTFDTNLKMPTWAQISSQLRSQSNPVVFFDISIGTMEVGRMIFELFADVAPQTAENFRQFCVGEMKNKEGLPVGYKGAVFHRVIKDFMCQGGDFINADGTGSMSIYGPTFEDENFTLSHDGPGLLSMANSGPNTNGCQFFITCASADFLNGKHCVFGKVIDGLLVLRKIENVPVGANHRPKINVSITNCGQL